MILNNPFHTVLVVSLLMLSSTTQSRASDWSLQSTNTLTVTNDDSNTYETGARARLAAIGGYSSGSISISAEFGFSFETDSSELNFQIQEAYLTWQPVGGFSLLAGRRVNSTGLMDFISPAEFLSPIDLVSFASGTTSSLRMAADVFEVTMYGAAWKLVGTVLPLSPSFSSLNPDSIWFPRNQFPQSLEILFSTWYLNKIIVNYPEHQILAPFPAFQLHGSYAQNNAELIAGIYLGPDPEPLYRFRLRVAEVNPCQVYESYNVLIYTEREPLLAGFLSAAWTNESIRIYGETSFSPSRRYSERLDSESLVLATDVDGYTLWSSAWAVDTGIGIAAFFQPLNLDLIIEARHLMPDPEINIRKPLFSSITTMYAQRRWLDGKLDTSLLAALTPGLDNKGGFNGNYGWALSFSVLWRPSMEMEFRIGLPLFGGDEETDLGRYAMIRQGSLTAIIRH